MLVRWNDWPTEVEHAWPHLDDLRRHLLRAFEGAPQDLAAGAPRTRLLDAGDHLHVEADLPGVRPSDIEVSLTDGVFTVKATRRATVPEGASVHRRERGDLRLSRSWALPVAVNADAVEASSKDGVLTVKLPKAQKAQARRIPVHVL